MIEGVLYLLVSVLLAWGLVKLVESWEPIKLHLVDLEQMTYNAYVKDDLEPFSLDELIVWADEVKQAPPGHWVDYCWTARGPDRYL